MFYSIGRKVIFHVTITFCCKNDNISFYVPFIWPFQLKMLRNKFLACMPEGALTISIMTSSTITLRIMTLSTMTIGIMTIA